MSLNYATSITLLAIDGIDLTDYSVRGLTMTLQPIVSGTELVRSVDGVLMDWSSPQFHKFASTITCADVDPPTLLDVWVGKTVTVTCVNGLVGDNTANTGTMLASDGTLTLDMMVSGWRTSRDDYGCTTSWELDLLEV